MAAGCKTEPEEEFDPSGGKTVVEKYWGTYTTTWDSGRHTVILSEKKLVDIYNVDDSRREFQAWTDDVNLYIYWTLEGYESEISHYGVFTSDTSFYRQGISTDWIYTKVDD
ncbi:hypothetical protein AGMMS49991_05110 [Spirochaetia bacterium]|nr:hypothetical protein AGMMS49991_05110 [Spirochaetia bacterium]